MARVWGIWFGVPHTLCRPDEETIVSLAGRFFSRDFNPHFFRYPTFYMYCVAAVYLVFFNLGRMTGRFPSESGFHRYWNADPTIFFLIDRMLVAAAGTATVWLTYRIGEKLFDRATGIVAAFFLALAMLHVRDSHFGVTDVPATFLAVASFLFTVRAVEARSPKDLRRSAILAGLAASTKYNVALIALPGLIAALGMWNGSTIGRRLRAGGLYAAIVVLFFLLGTPYALLDSGKFFADVRAESAHLLGGHGGNLGRGWHAHLVLSLRYGLGLPLLIASLAGLAWMALRAPRKGLLLAVFPAMYFGVLGAGYTTFIRYMVPVVPFLCLAAAFCVVRVARVVADTIPALRPSVAAGVLAAFAIAPSAWAVVQIDRLLARVDNRLLAARWIETAFPSGASMYQAGLIYGQVQFWPRPLAARFVQWTFDPGTGAFLIGAARAAGLPELIVTQSSPLDQYGITDPAVSELLAARYVLARRFDAFDPAAKGNIYDQQDAFYLPMAGFHGIERPGPTLLVYKRRADR